MSQINEPVDRDKVTVEECEGMIAQCVCSNVRRLSRTVTQIYDNALRPIGLRSGQFAMLLTMRVKGKSTAQQLAGFLGLDQSALTRAVRPLEAKGLLQIEVGSDRRVRYIKLTPEGEKTIRQGIPFWNQAQSSIKASMSEPEVERLLETISHSSIRLEGRA